MRELMMMMETTYILPSRERPYIPSAGSLSFLLIETAKNCH